MAAHGAFETKTLTAAEAKNKFDLDLSLTFDRAQKRAKITREWVQAQDGTLTALDVKELRYEEVVQRLIVAARVGIFRDLELHIDAPIILGQDSNIRFADGVEGRSTLCCDGSPNADDPMYRAAPRYPVTDVPAERFRAGFGDMTFGLAWSPFVDLKDEAYPTLTLKGDVQVPTGKTWNPADPAALIEAEGGSVGSGLTVFDLSLGLSRRMQLGTPALDPYMLFGARIPIASGSQKDRGMEPPTSGRFLVGTEIVLWEDDQAHQKYAFDLSFQTRYVGTGRTYSELSDYLPAFNPTRVLGNRVAGDGTRADEFVYSDFANAGNYDTQVAGASCGKIQGVACGELNKVDEYLELKGQAAVHLAFTEYAYIRAGLSIEHTTDHFLTNERVGKDLDPATASTADCDGADCVGRVNARNSFYDRDANVCPAGKTCDERNPHYDPRYDALGRRLRVEETVNWTFFVTGAATF